MRLFLEAEGWDSMKRDVRQTRSMLRGSAVHTPLAKHLDKALERWRAIDAARDAADDEVTDANALVAWLDLALDAATNRLLGQLGADCSNNREHPTFRAFFPDAPNEMIRQALESQLDESARFFAAAKTAKPSKVVLAVLDEIRGIEKAGRAALDARKKAVLAAAEVSLRVQSWRDDANAIRRSVETSLDDHANKNGLARDYAGRFFPTARASTKKKVAPTGPVTPPG